MSAMNYFNNHESDSAQCLYSEKQNLYVHYTSKEERQRHALVTVELLKGVSPVSEKSLSLKLTDDDDPFFFYSLLMTETDYTSLKAQQGLLIDFLNFPAQLVTLLQLCKEEKENPYPKFLLVLDENCTESMLEGMNTYLRVMEKNQFKHLCHLYLQIACGSDQDIKMYMAAKINLLTEAVKKTTAQLGELEGKLCEISNELQIKCTDLDDVKKQWSEDKNLLQRENLRQLNEEREHFAHARLDWQKELDYKIKEDEKRYLEKVTNLELQLTNLKVEYQHNYEKLCEANCLIRELTDKITGMEKELCGFKKDISAIQRHNIKLDADYHEKARTVICLHHEKTTIEKELEEKNNLVIKQQKEILDLNDRKEQLQEEMEVIQGYLKKKNINIAVLSNDLLKANEILAKFQLEQFQTSNKLLLRTNINIEQEKILEKKQEEFNTMHQYLKGLENESKNFKELEEKLKESLAIANTKLDEKEKMVKNNENVINWLSRKLTEAHSKLSQPLPPDCMAPTTSTPYSTIVARCPTVGRQVQPLPVVNQTAPRSAGSRSAVSVQHPPSFYLKDHKMLQPYVPTSEELLLNTERNMPMAAQRIPVMLASTHLPKPTDQQVQPASKQVQPAPQQVQQVRKKTSKQVIKPKGRIQNANHHVPLSAYFSKLNLS